MCSSLYLFDLEITSLGQARAIFGDRLQDLPDVLRAGSDDSCLCCTDFRATAEACGMVAVSPAFDGGDPMEWRFVAKGDEPAPDRIQRDDEGELDEIVASGGAHLERLNDTGWYLSLTQADGTETRLWFDGRVTMEETTKGDRP